MLHTGDTKKNKIPFLHSIACSAVGRADRFKKQHVFSGMIAARSMRSGKPSEWSCFTDFLKINNNFLKFY